MALTYTYMHGTFSICMHACVRFSWGNYKACMEYGIDMEWCTSLQAPKYTCERAYTRFWGCQV